MPSASFQLDSDRRSQLIDITEQVARLAAEAPGAGAVLVSSLHTTAGITVNEGYDADVAGDLVRALEPLADRGDYRHAEGNSDSHLRVALVGASQLVPVQAGALALGTWQRIFFCEFDGPRQGRRVLVTPLAAAPA